MAFTPFFGRMAPTDGSSFQTTVLEIMSVVSLIVSTVLFSWQWMERPGKERWMLSPYAVKHHNEKHRVLTHALVHADWMHLAFNMFVLYEFGRHVEVEMQKIGAWAMPLLYVLGVLGGALPALARHQDNPRYRSLGASGAVSTVLLAFICLHPTETLLLFFVIPVPAILAGFLFFLYESKMQQSGNTGIAHDAHIGGAIVGVAWVFLLVPDAWPSFLAELGQWWN